MNGWGRAVFLVTVGLSLGAGCGGRTGVEDGYDPDPDGGTPSTVAGAGGKSGSGGKPGTAGKGGRPNTAGNSFGGNGDAGSFPTGGSIGIAGVGGTPVTAGAPGFAGSFPTGGFSFGGAFPTGGVGGVGGSSPLDCQTCIFQTCSGPAQACFSDFGCLAIFGCVAQTGCDTFECYTPDTCGPIIDQFGGPFGPSMTALLDTVSCALTSGCPCN